MGVSRKGVVTDEERARFRDLYDRGLTFRAIARRTGRAYSVVQKGLGDVPSNYKVMTPELVERAVALRQGGMTCFDVGVELGFTGETISRFTRGKAPRAQSVKQKNRVLRAARMLVIERTRT